MAPLILHVDDRPELPAGVAEALQEDGYDLVQVTDPEEAIRRVEESDPVLVLMELDLSVCDGLDLLAGLLARSTHASGLPVLVLTRAQRSSGLYGEAIAVGVSDFLSKPALASQLLASIRALAPPPPKTPEPEPAADPSRPELSGGLADRSRPELSGGLADTPLPEILARLRRRGATGVLIASRGQRHIGVELRNGSPLAVSSNGKRPPRSEQMSALAPDEIETAIGRWAETELFEAFRWTDGSYRFIEDKTLASAAALGNARDPAGLLLAGALEASPLETLRDRLRKRAALYVSVEADESALEGVKLTPEQKRTLAGLGGDATLGEILESDAFEDRLLYGLWVAGQLELHAAPTLALIEEICRDEAETGREAAAVDAAPPPPADGREALALSLRDLAQRVMAGDDFEALDIPVFAPDGQVHAAYERIVKEIPEEALTSPDPDLRERARAIRDRVEAAHDHLKDPETRRAYALLRREEEQDRSTRTSAARALEAERWLRKGQGFLKRRRHDEAAEAFGMAAHLDPDEGEYLSHLGYALYLSKPGDDVVRREAMEHIANGIKRSPKRELSYVFLGRVLVAKGETETARKIFRRALRVKPDCHTALQELRLLERREQRGKGLLSRLRRR